ncbi:hypothetical protein LTR53_000010 [Teratosphaeriaceae sp. CCFEE 6253]|nr:hypothetical protein LTR53_000010 [Teratosphaeriaceae sp. CCFEE 6253]
MFLGNFDGKFTWNKKGFHDSARKAELSGSALSAELHNIQGQWCQDTFDLHDVLMNNDGTFQAVEVPLLLAIPKNQESVMVLQLSQAMAEPNFKLQAYDEPDGATVFCANATVEEEGTIFKPYTAEARASVMYLAKSSGKPIEVGVSTGIGIKDDSYEAKVLGWGFQIGRKVSISVFDNSFGIDFGRLFG